MESEKTRTTPEFTAEVFKEERALWDKIVADFVYSKESFEMMHTIMVKSKPKDESAAMKAAVMVVANFGASIADAVLAERRKRFSGVTHP